jgi:hypothetical protein
LSTGASKNLLIIYTSANYFASFEIISYTGTSSMGPDILKMMKTTSAVKFGDNAGFMGIYVDLYTIGY